MAVESHVECPFDQSIHIKTPIPTFEENIVLDRFYAAITNKMPELSKNHMVSHRSSTICIPLCLIMILRFRIS